MRLIQLIGIVALIASCQSPQKISGGLEETFSCEWNVSHTFQLCLTQPGKDQFPRPITYEIFDKGGNLIRNGRIRSGYVQWIDDTDLELFETPGMIPEGMTKDDLVRIYRIRSREFMSKTEYLNLKSSDSKGRKKRRKN